MIRPKVKIVRQEIPSTSLSDIIFMLLLFFMATTTMQNIEQKINPNIPYGDALEKLEFKKDVIYLLVDDKLNIQFNEKIVKKYELENILRKKLEENENLIVSLKIDKNVDMSYVKNLHKILRKAGCLRINYSILDSKKGE